MITPGYSLLSVQPDANESLVRLDWTDSQIKCWDECSFSDEPYSERPITESTGGVVGCCNVNVLTELTRKVDVLQRDVNVLKELTELTKKSNQTATGSTKKS